MILHNKKKISCKHIENELKSYHNKTEWANFVLMQDSWPQLMADSISRQNTLMIFIIHKFSGLSLVHFAKRWKLIGTSRLDSGEHWDWTRIGNHNLPPYKVNMEWTSELNLWTRTILTRGLEFLMAWISWSRTWTTTSRKSQKRSSNTVRWNRMHVLLQADRKPKQNHKDVFLPAHPHKKNFWWKNLDRYWTTRLFAQRLFSVEGTDKFSSSWWSTPKRWWSDWILEIKKIIFRTILSNLNNGLMKSGRAS